MLRSPAHLLHLRSVGVITSNSHVSLNNGPGIMVPFAKFKKWHPLDNLYCIAIQRIRIPKLAKWTNS